MGPQIWYVAKTDGNFGLIGATTTEAGLKIKCVVDYGEYKKGIEVTDEALAKVNLSKDEFHGEWNYSISPNNQ